MKVLISERKGASSSPPREGRVSFDDCLRQGTVFIVTVPRNDGTLDMISDKEFKLMRKDAILINVGRGGIVNEKAAASALKEGRLNAAAIDVYEREPPEREVSALLDATIPNLILSPHIAWFSAESIQNLQNAVLKGISSYVAGTPINALVRV
jgi:glycerate dehydrogenase